MEQKNLIFITIIIAIIVLFFFDDKEHYVKYADPEITQFAQNSKNPKSIQLTKIGTRDGTDPLEGMLFSDVTFFEGSHTIDGDIGLERCIKKCKNGTCVEYGQTGDAYCYPKDYASIKDYPVKSQLSKISFRPG